MFITNIHTLLSLAFSHDFTGSEIAKHKDTDNAMTNGESWLSDGAITGYFAMLQLIDSYLQSIQPQPSNRHRSLFINSIQFDVLIESINSRNWEKVKTFWKKQLDKQSPPPLSIFDMDKIFIAENVNNSHWTMTVIFFKHKSIVYYDSFNDKPNDSNPNPLLDMLENMDSSNEQKQFDRKEWRFTLATCVQQSKKKVIFLLFFEYSSYYSE